MIESELRPSLPWREIGCGLGLALVGLAAALMVSPQQSFFYDTSIMADVTRSILTDGTFRVSGDAWGINTPYASYGLGMSLLFAPPYWIAQHLHRDPGSWVMLTTPVVFGLTLPAVFWLTIGCGATRRQGAITTLLVGFGTLLFAYAGTGLSEPAVGLGIAVGLAALTTATRRPVLGGAVAGMAAGVTVLMRTDSALLVAPILAAGVWLLAGRRAWALVAFAGGLLPWALAAAAYNVVRYGAPWRLGYAVGGTNLFNHPIPGGIYGLTLSPGAGLLWYVPLVAVALLGMPRAARRMPALTAVTLALLLVRFPVYAALFSWNGGGSWGPRYLTPAMPALALGILEVVRAFPALSIVSRLAVSVVAVLSVLIQFTGATVNPGSTNLAVASSRLVPPPSREAWLAMTRPEIQERQDGILFDWGLFPIPNEAANLVHGRNLMPRTLPHQGPRAGAFEPAPRARMIAVLGGFLVLGLALAWLTSRGGSRTPPSVDEREFLLRGSSDP